MNKHKSSPSAPASSRDPYTLPHENLPRHTPSPLQVTDEEVTMFRAILKARLPKFLHKAIDLLKDDMLKQTLQQVKLSKQSPTEVFEQALKTANPNSTDTRDTPSRHGKE